MWCLRVVGAVFLTSYTAVRNVELPSVLRGLSFAHLRGVQCLGRIWSRCVMCKSASGGHTCQGNSFGF
jgi:hypothetical protein